MVTTPESLRNQRAIAQALAGHALVNRAIGPFSAVAQALAGFGGGLIASQADRTQTQATEQANQALLDAMSGRGGTQSVTQALINPFANKTLVSAGAEAEGLLERIGDSPAQGITGVVVKAEVVEMLTDRQATLAADDVEYQIQAMAASLAHDIARLAA